MIDDDELLIVKEGGSAVFRVGFILSDARQPVNKKANITRTTVRGVKPALRVIFHHQSP